MEAILHAIPVKGKLIFRNEHDLYRYCMEHEGVELTITMKATAKTSEKMRMYAYLYGPLLDAAVRGYSHAGWELMDKYKAMYLLQCEVAKDVRWDPVKKKEVVFPMPTSKMNKERLLKFIQDILFLLESELQQDTPDSTTWKMYKLGEGLKAKQLNKNNQ